MRTRLIFIPFLLSAAIALLIVFGRGTGPFFEEPAIESRVGAMTGASELLNLNEAIEHYRFEIRRKPEVVENYVQMARLFQQRGRITGQHHEAVRQAQRYIDEALSRDSGNFEAIITQAAIFLTSHNFELARSWAEKALALNDFDAFAWGVYSDALKELGEYEKAVAACDRMMSIRPDLRSYSRAAHLRELHGDLNGARHAMQLAVDAGIIGLESHAWAVCELAKLYLKQGQIEEAAGLFRGILKCRPNYPHAKLGLADIAALQGDYQAAIQLALDASRIAPEHSFMQKVVAFYDAAGQAEKAQSLANSVLQAYEEHEKEGWNINLEYATFCLDLGIRQQEALRRMEAEYKRRGNNVEVQEIYGRTLCQNGKIAEAASVLSQAMQRNANDAELCYWAGVVAYELGETENAGKHLAHALAMNPHLAHKHHIERLLRALRGNKLISYYN